MSGARRPRGARPVRRGPLRPRRPRRDDAPARRDRGLPPAALPQPGADHHADRPRRRGRQGARPRDRRRRLHHQAVQRPRVPQPREGGAAPHADARRAPARRRSAPARSTIDFGAPRRSASAASGSSSPTSSSRSSPRSRSTPGRVFDRDTLLERVWGDSAYRDPRTIDVHIRHLREKIERDAKRARVPVHGARRRLPLPRGRGLSPGRDERPGAAERVAGARSAIRSSVRTRLVLLFFAITAARRRLRLPLRRPAAQLVA